MSVALAVYATPPVPCTAYHAAACVWVVSLVVASMGGAGRAAALAVAAFAAAALAAEV